MRSNATSRQSAKGVDGPQPGIQCWSLLMSRMACRNRRSQTLGRLAVCLAAFFASPPTRADDAAPRQEDRFAAEPMRPKAETPVRFSSSWEEGPSGGESIWSPDPRLFYGRFLRLVPRLGAANLHRRRGR